MPGINLTSRRFYWACQLGGWVLYVLLNAFLLFLNDDLNGNIAFGLTFIFMLGIILTQGLRWLVIRLNWLQLSISSALPRVLFVNLLMGIAIAFILSGLDNLAQVSPARFNLGKILINVASYTFVFFSWSLIYFLVHFLENYKKAEIENLRWEAASREAELNRLKSQLNPHFMFNAMNSIRALVGENPARAKEAVTQLANLLRNTLQMGKYKLIPFGQELDVVKDYVAIESVRLEERLQVEWNIEAGCESVELPPLMLQTLVENGIKHGIAKIPEGGKLTVNAKRINNGLDIIIRNSGQYDEKQSPESGFGLRNTLERLELLYGTKARFSIANENSHTVITRLFIPELNGTKNASS